MRNRKQSYKRSSIKDTSKHSNLFSLLPKMAEQGPTACCASRINPSERMRALLPTPVSCATLLRYMVCVAVNLQQTFFSTLTSCSGHT